MFSVLVTAGVTTSDTRLSRLRRIGPLAWLGLMVGGWIVFFVLAFASPATLDDFWVWVGGLPLPGQAAVWLLLLPWMLALAVLESDWDTWVRVVVIAVIALGWTIASVPRAWRSR